MGEGPALDPDAEDFLSKVDEISSLIDGLKSGTVTPDTVDYIERKKEKEAEEKRRKDEEQRKAAEASKFDNLPPEKQRELKERVNAMIKEKERRESARARYSEYMKDDPKAGEKSTKATDYTAWDLWEPSDDEADPWVGMAPDNPAFKAMEQDLNKRAARAESKRQAAFRWKEKGNAALKAGQPAEALRCYELGLEADKRSIELHSNATMAALKMGSNILAIEHADKVLSLAEYYHDQPNHPLAVKALQRRAAARTALKHFSDAVADLEEASKRLPNDAEILKQLRKAVALNEEDKRERAVRAAAANLAEGSADQGGDAGRLDALREVERLARAIAVEGASSADAESEGGEAASAQPERSARSAALPSPRAAVASLEGVLESSDDARTYFRVCGGLVSLVSRSKALCSALPAPEGLAGCALPPRAGKEKKAPKPAAADPSGAGDAAAALRALRAAALSELNGSEILASGAVSGAAVPALCCGRGPEAAAAAACLLHSLTELPEHRKAVVRELSASRAALEGLLAASRPPAASGAAPGEAQLAAHALGLLVNCALEPQARAQLAASSSAGAGVASAAAALLGPAPGLPQPLKALLRERAASLVTNACADAGLRSALAASATLVSALVSALRAPPASPGEGFASQQRDEQEAVAAAAAALANLTLDPAAAASAAAAGAPAQLAALLPDGADAARALCGGGASTSGAGGEMPLLVAQRAAAAAARVARAPGAAELFLSAGGAKRLALLLEAATGGGAGLGAGVSADAADAAARALAVCAGAAPAASWEGVKAAGGVGPLLAVVRMEGAPDALVGNVALALAELAKADPSLPAFAKADAVHALLGAAVKRTGAAQKNAGIALARLARDKDCLERLRELNGVQIIASYIK